MAQWRARYLGVVVRATLLACALACSSPATAESGTTSVTRTVTIAPEQVRIDHVTGIASYQIAGLILAGTAKDPYPDFPFALTLPEGVLVDSVSVSIESSVLLTRQRGSTAAFGPASAVGSWYPGLGSELRLSTPDSMEFANHRAIRVSGPLTLMLRPLQRHDLDGCVWLATSLQVTLALSGDVLGVDAERQPTEVTLEVVGANPSRGQTRIRYFIPAANSAQSLDISIYDVSGRRVRSLSVDDATSGWSEAIWDGQGADGHNAGPGVYFCRLKVANKSLVRRLVLTH